MNRLIKILICFLFPLGAMAQSQVHENVFNDIPAGSGTHFWLGIYDWDAWQQNSAQSALGLIPNMVKKAVDEGYRNDAAQFSLEGLQGPVTAAQSEAMSAYFETSEELDASDISALRSSKESGVVVALKIQMDLPADANIADYQDRFVDKFIFSDSPHTHAKVSTEWAKGVLPPTHWGQKILADSGPNGQALLTLIEVNEDYNCSFLSSPLRLYLETRKERSVLDAPTIYGVSLVRAGGSGGVVEPGANLIWEQNILYTSAVLRSGRNFISFYDTPAGKKVILQSYVVLSSEIASRPNLLSALIYGVSMKNMAHRVEINSGQADVDIGYLLGDGNQSDTCQAGLGQGIPRYYMNLLERL